MENTRYQDYTVPNHQQDYQTSNQQSDINQTSQTERQEQLETKVNNLKIKLTNIFNLILTRLDQKMERIESRLRNRTTTHQYTTSTTETTNQL